jgi:OOP family OmpA-OmpF porin
VLDTSYVGALAAHQAPTTAAASLQHFETTDKIKNVVSRRSWNIQFETGKADFTPAAKTELEQLQRDLLVAGATVVELHGHTDAQGNPAANMALSEARAFAVKNWLEQQAPINFPEGRLHVFAHGQMNPVAPNATDAGRAQNRRVEIVMGTAS